MFRDWLLEQDADAPVFGTASFHKPGDADEDLVVTR
jgi:hypothetical protein